MAKRKRTSKRSDLVGRAVRAGRSALREAESHVPADLRRQVERRLKDAEKTARVAIKQLQQQVKRASTRADVNSVLKRIDGLTKQARQVAKGTTGRATSPRRRTAASTTRRAASRTRKAAGSTRRRTATSPRRSTTARRTAARPAATTPSATTPRRRSAPRRARPAETAMSGMPEVHTVPMPEMGTGGMGGVSET